MTKKIYSCDFETTTKEDDCRVWAWGYMDVYDNNKYKIGTDIDSFMRWMLFSNASIYFHNLKFDGSFIVNWLLQKGYKWTKERNPGVGEFSTIISNMGQWYSITITSQLLNKKSKVKIYDSLKKLPFSVEKIAKDFNLPILKGNIDYELERPVGWEITPDERKYIKHDIEIIAKALAIQLSQGLTAMTNGSDALQEFTTLSGPTYEKLFPVLDLELNAELRRAYRGGFTWVNPKIQGQEIGDGIVFDVNSLYPSVMYDKPMPCGHPVYFEGQYKPVKSHPLYIQKLTFEFELKEGHIPTIQIKNSRYGFKENEYLSSSNDERVTLYLSNVDWELIQDHYEVHDVVYEYGFMFRKTTNAFKDYIDKWMEIKNTSKGAIKLLAKLMLNSLYGKFATNPNVTGKVPVLKEDGLTLGFKLGDEEFRDPVYTPVGVFTTAYAREVTIRTAQSVYDRILYCDTDSIHLKGLEEPNINISDDKLGYWKKEGEFKRAKFVRQKTYVEDYYMRFVYDDFGNKLFDDDGNPITKHCTKPEADTSHLDVKCAGMPSNIKKHVTFENFKVGFKADGKLQPKQVPNGVILQPRPFEIK